MRYLFFLSLFPFLVTAQTGSYIGLSANTGIYQLYNYNDWNSSKATGIFDSKIEPKKSIVSNLYNTSLGLHFGHSYNERNALDFSLCYNRYRQDYVIDKTYDFNRPSLYYYYFTKLKYITFNANWYYTFIKRNKSEIKPSFYIMGGVHVSYLIHYFEQGNITDGFFNFIPPITSTHILTNDNGNILHKTYFSNQPSTTDYSSTENIFTKYSIGVDLGVGVKKNLTERINIRLGLNFKYDLNNVENRDAILTTYTGSKINYYQSNSRILGTYREEKRKSTHNIYYGFGFSLFWYLNRQSY